MKTPRILFTLLLSVLYCAHPAQALTLSSFDAPESMIVDPDDGSYYVSNVNGDPLAKDMNGYISKIDASGKTVIQKFIGAGRTVGVLNAPKGLVIVGTLLFVTDIDTVRGFNKETGRLAVTVDFSKFKPKFLNDIATDNRGDIYVSDMLTNRIFMINAQRDYEVSDYTSGAQLGGPNGLLVNPKNGNLIVVTYDSGQILEIDAVGRRHVLKRGLTRLDGVDYDNQLNLYVSSIEKGEIYKITRAGRGTITTLYSGLTSPADISVDRRRQELLIPSFKGGQVSTLPLTEPVKGLEKPRA